MGWLATWSALSSLIPRSWQAAFPAALSVLNCVTYSFRLASEVALGYAEEVRAKLWAEHMWAFLATIYLFLPACSQAQFEALDCKTL